MNTKPMPSPTFDDYDNFSATDLQSLLKCWVWIKDNSAWAEWHGYAAKFIAELETELKRRSDREP